MDIKIHHSACSLNCPDLCAYVIEVVDGRVVRLRGDERHDYTQGRCCPKGYAHVERMYHKDRLIYPLRKMPDGSFTRVTWKDALDEISNRIRNAMTERGPRSVGIYSGSGNDGMAPRYASRFANVIGSPMIPGIAEICFEGAYEGARFNVGPFPPHELSDWLNSRCIVVWGTNKVESGIHTKRVIREARNRGALLIVIDPRKTPHAHAADIYTTIRPGTDGALALGIANEIIERDLIDHEFVERNVHGFKQYAQRVSIYDKEKVSRITWVPKHKITDIAIAFATHGPSLITTAPAGMNHYTNGTWSARAVHSLLAICGYIGRPGGGFQYLSSDNSPFADITLKHLLPESVKPVVPSATYLPDYILRSDESPLGVLVVQAANPITQWPNTNKTRLALERIPFKVCIDLEMTDTARACDLVLPATFIFEHHNLVHSEIHRIVQYAPKIVEPRGEAKTELDIWREIAERLGLGQYFRASETDLIREALLGDHCSHISLDDLVNSPHGIRTSSPGVPFSDLKFSTPTGKIELYSTTLEKMGYDPLPFHEEPAESPLATPDVYVKYPLIMITGRLRNRLHSQYVTVSVGGQVKSYSHCTSCRKCVDECPDEAISMSQPTSREIESGWNELSESPALMRKTLGSLVYQLAVDVTDTAIPIPQDLSSLLVPRWDATKCIGCRECELDVCPYSVIAPTLMMSSHQTESVQRAFLRMHPIAAERLSLEDGDLVRVESQRGAVDPMRLELAEDIDPRVVWASDGWWESSGNVNNLTADLHTDFGSTPGFNSVLVRVTKSDLD